MRRATLTGLAMAILLAPMAIGTEQAASAGAEPGCTMRRHSKRVIRHVHRHGKLHTVHRTHYWWSCEPAPVVPGGGESSAPSTPPAPDPGPPPTPTPEPAPEPEPTGNHLGVKAVEYSYTLSRPTVSAGEVTIELDDRGQDAHDLNLRPVGSEGPPLEIEETGSGERRSAHFTLEPGVYRLWCSLPTHDEQGMHATLVVEAP